MVLKGTKGRLLADCWMQGKTVFTEKYGLGGYFYYGLKEQGKIGLTKKSQKRTSVK